MVEMLSDLLIAGFRAFKRLEIPKLARVNLITGKNNSGKSAILEALRLYATGASPDVLEDLLESRDEGPVISSPPSSNALNVLAIFRGRKSIDDIDQHPRIEIGPLSSSSDRLVVTATWYSSTTDLRGARQYYKTEDNPGVQTRVPVIEVSQWGSDLPYPLDRNMSEWLPRRKGPAIAARLPQHQYLGPNSLTRIETTRLWDQVTLREGEDDVTHCLKLIAPEVERVNVVATGMNQERTPFVRVRGSSDPVPLRSLGDGMYRLFGLALAMVNTRDGWLLVDEIENGIHYSIQPRLWDFIVQLATRLNVQVFATTHSWDCITAFQKAAREHDSDGMLIRLDWRNGSVRAVEFTESELAVATRESIEVR